MTPKKSPEEASNEISFNTFFSEVGYAKDTPSNLTDSMGPLFKKHDYLNVTFFATLFF